MPLQNESLSILCINALLGLLKEAIHRATGVGPPVVADGWSSLMPGLAADAFRTTRIEDSENNPEAAFYKRFERREVADPERAKVVRIRRGSPGAVAGDAHANVDFSVEFLPEFETSDARLAIICELFSEEFAVRVAISGLPAAAVDSLRAGTHAFDNGTGGLSLRFLIEPALAGTLTVTPDRILHDGSNRAESDGEFQWLWTGPDKHFRILLGVVETRPATLRITIVSEGCPGNSENIRAFVNGVARDVQFEAWGNGSGRLTTTISQDDDNPLVLSLLVPALHDVEGRRLGVCVGTLEILGKAE